MEKYRSNQLVQDRNNFDNIVHRTDISNIRTLQIIQAHFCALNGIENTPQAALSRLIEEVEECQDAMIAGDIKEIKGEIADIAIFALTTASTLEIDLEHAMQNFGVIGDTVTAPVKIFDNTSLDLNLLQERQRSSTDQPPTADAAHKALAEIAEQTKEAIKNGNRHLTTLGLTSIIVGTADIANHYGISLASAINDKLTRNYVKYNPIKSQALQGIGMNQAERLATQRAQWDKNADNNFMK